MASSEHVLPRLITLREIEKVTAEESFLDELILAIRQGFLDSDSFYAAPIQTLGAPPAPPFVSDCDDYSAQTCVKSGYFSSSDFYVIKVASGGKPWSSNSGLLQVYSQKTGRLEALLLDEGMLTELRTAAMGALAAQLWAPKNVSRIGMLGCGVQARYQLKLLSRVTRCRKVVVYGRTQTNVQRYVDEMTELGWNVTVAETPNALFESCQVVVTTTDARKPLLTEMPSIAHEQREGLLLICIGADAPGKSEVDPSVLEMADLRIADNPEQSRERGEFHQSNAELPVLSLREAMLDSSTLRQAQNDRRFIVVDSSGLALQDCVISQLVYQQLNLDEITN